MIAVESIVVALVFGSGAALMLRRDLISLVAGSSLLSSAAFVFLVASGGSLGVAPIHPIPQGAAVSDPVVQALALTGLVINVATTAVLIALVRGTWADHRTIDLDELARIERREERDAGEPG
jgi:multicomponent Na+:H+ antiporter subunit C